VVFPDVGADYKIDLPRFIMLEVDGYTGVF